MQSRIRYVWVRCLHACLACIYTIKENLIRNLKRFYGCRKNPDGCSRYRHLSNSEDDTGGQSADEVNKKYSGLLGIDNQGAASTRLQHIKRVEPNNNGAFVVEVSTDDC